MTAIPSAQATTPREAKRVPPLANGERLSRDEFERRYAAMPETVKAELIEGVVYVPSPARHEQHANPYCYLLTWIGTYDAATTGVDGAGNGTLRLDLDNEPQPDALLLIHRRLGGQARIDEDGYVEGPPELVAEVAASSVSYDLHDKLNAYSRNGVREYVVWRVLDEAIDWFVLREGQYVRLEPDASGVYRSEVLPGLWLDPEALVRRDLAAVLQRLQEGLASPEHAEFVARLRESGEQGRG